MLAFSVASALSWSSSHAIGGDNGFQTDKVELQKHLTLDQPLDEVRWEMFGTPEWLKETFLPPRTDYISIVVSAPFNPRVKLKNASRGRLFSTINSVRPWLDSAEANVMRSTSDSDFKVDESPFKCTERKFFSKKYNSSVYGFECISKDRYLAYALLAILGK